MISFIILPLALAQIQFQYPIGSPVSKYGRLSVQGLQLVSQSGERVQLKGMSTHGPQWFANCYTYASFQALANDWKADVIRIAMYVNENGYNTNPAYWKDRVRELADWAGQLGLYVLIDWHVLTPGNPYDASYGQVWDFFTTMAQQYSKSYHVLYEIANEPNGVSWEQFVPYHTDIIKLIRNYHPASVIIVGTPNWSSDLWSISPLQFPNLLYTLHFYAASNEVTDAQRQAAGRYPIFVTEYGTCTYSGDGEVNLQSAEGWLSFMSGNNAGGQYISFINWTFSDAGESCAALYPGSCAQQNWNNLKQSGQWVKSKLQENSIDQYNII